MWQWLQDDLQWKEKLGFSSRKRHHLPGLLMQWDKYMNQVASVANLEPIPEVVVKIFKYFLVLAMVQGLTKTRGVSFTMTADKTNFSVRPFSWLVSVVYYVVLLLTAIGILQ